MGILANYAFRNSNPGRDLGGITDSYKAIKPTTMMLTNLQDDIKNDFSKSSIFEGTSPPYSYVLSLDTFNLSSSYTKASLSSSGNLVGGKPASGSSTITFTTTATGGLIVSGSGSASITLSATGTVLSVASASGSATITLSGSALIGALAGVAGTSSITLTPTATITAIGYLQGLASNESEFSPDALARAIWDALRADYNVAGSMGETMNNLGAGANPWSALLADNNDPDTFGERVQKLLTTAKFIGLK